MQVPSLGLASKLGLINQLLILMRSLLLSVFLFIFLFLTLTALEFVFPAYQPYISRFKTEFILLITGLAAIATFWSQSTL